MAELDRILPLIIDCGVEKVILFGSLAGGSSHGKSDIDLLVVKRTPERFLNRAEEFYEAAEPALAVDFLVYTPSELKRLAKSRRFIRGILSRGKVLYEKKPSG
jgi:predicted nucleotidyltransferase